MLYLDKKGCKLRYEKQPRERYQPLLKKTSHILFILVFMTLTSCMTMTKSIFGIQDAKPISDSTMADYAGHFKIPIQDNYTLDTTYAKFLFSLDTTQYKQQIKNHYQPLQALYFDKNGQLLKFYINCYAGGFPTLKWNRNGILNTFLPQDQAPVDSILNLDKQVIFLKSTDKSSLTDIYNYDYTVFIYWNQFMKRHSKHLIKEIRKNCKLADNKTVKIIYVNNDNFFAYFYKNNGW